jgi:arginyl-tRNA synthetase
MNLFAHVRSRLVLIVERLQQDGRLPGSLPLEAIDVMPPREEAHGEMATNAAMALAQAAQVNPRALAEMLLAPLQALPEVTSAEIAGPGFINLRFTPAFWQGVLPVILKEGLAYGHSTMGAYASVNVEYVSANPTGPLHVGHGRGAVYGDALAALLEKAGFRVTREYYVNDGGAQIEVLAESAYLRYREACGETIDAIPEGLYPGDYLVPVGQALFARHGRALLSMEENARRTLVRDFAVERMMELIRQDLAELRIRHDVFTSERAIVGAGRIEAALATLEAKGLLYTGTLEPPRGKTPEDWEPRPQLLFRSTLYGDDMDRPIRKSDGSWTYFAPDIAYHHDKLQRLGIQGLGIQEVANQEGRAQEKKGQGLLVDILGADHGGYAKRIQAAVSALSDGKARVDVKLCQIVKFLRDGEPVKMSKRKGTFMTVREVVDEVGNGAFRFIMLTRKNDAPLDFDFAQVVKQTRENPVFYVQYAHARFHSLLRMAQEQTGVALPFSEHPGEAVTALLTEPAELALLRQLALWPRVIEGAAAACEPHRIAFYLQELAASFHGLWNLGNQTSELRFIQPENLDLTAARLALARGCAMVIKSGLEVLGVEPVKEMR